MTDVPLILAVVTLVVAGQVLLKIGMNRVGEIGREQLGSPLALIGRLLRTPAVVGGLLLYAVSAAGWVYVLSRVELSYAYPFLALSYAAVTAIAVAVLKEPFTRAQWLGVLCVVLGVTTVAASG